MCTFREGVLNFVWFILLASYHSGTKIKMFFDYDVIYILISKKNWLPKRIVFILN